MIVDAREAFARSDRFSRVATVHVGWPAEAIEERALGPRDAVIVFSHDPKFDEPAILAALRSDAGYIGALGSRRTARRPQPRACSRPARDPAALDARALAVRARHRRRDPGGGRDLDHGRGDRRALGPRRRAAGQRRAARSARAEPQLLDGVDVAIAAEPVARRRRAPARRQQDSRAPWSPRSDGDRREQRCARAAPGGRGGRRSSRGPHALVPSRAATTRSIARGSIAGWSPRVIDDRVDARRRARRRRRAATPPGPPPSRRRSRPRRRGARRAARTASAWAPSTTTRGSMRARRGHREQRVLEQRPAVERRELLRRAEAAASPGGQDEPADRCAVA